MKFFLATTFGT